MLMSWSCMLEEGNIETIEDRGSRGPELVTPVLKYSLVGLQYSGRGQMLKPWIKTYFLHSCILTDNKKDCFTAASPLFSPLLTDLESGIDKWQWLNLKLMLGWILHRPTETGFKADRSPRGVSVVRLWGRSALHVPPAPIHTVQRHNMWWMLIIWLPLQVIFDYISPSVVSSQSFFFFPKMFFLLFSVGPWSPLRLFWGVIKSDINQSYPYRMLSGYSICCNVLTNIHCARCYCGFTVQLSVVNLRPFKVSKASFENVLNLLTNNSLLTSSLWHRILRIHVSVLRGSPFEVLKASLDSLFFYLILFFIIIIIYFCIYCQWLMGMPCEKSATNCVIFGDRITV